MVLEDMLLRQLQLGQMPIIKMSLGQLLLIQILPELSIENI
jgi:hypothetical protein